MKVLIFLILLSPCHLFAKGFQFNLLGGIDYPNEGAETPNGTLLRFQLATYPTTFRIQSSFTAMVAGDIKQGEFSLGPMFYFLSPLLKESPAQPFIETEGIFGVGQKDSNSRMITGYALGAGVDLRFWAKSGFTINAKMKAAGETSFRILAGFYVFQL